MPKRRIGQRISKKVVESLLEDSQWILDEELSTPKISLFIYRHLDGRVLSKWLEGDGVLVAAGDSQQYLNRKRAMKNAMASARPGRGLHILNGKLPQGQDFAAQVPALIQQLAELLNLKPDDLDFSNASLLKVDRKLKRRGAAKCLEVPIFPALLAYLGEMTRREMGGEWRMRYDPKDEQWEPWLVDPAGRVCQVWIDLHKTLLEGPIVTDGLPAQIARYRQLPQPGFWDPAEQPAEQEADPRTVIQFVMHAPEESEPRMDAE